MYARQLDPADDLSGLPDALISGNQAVLALANCFQLCRFNFHILRDARLTESSWANVHSRLRQEFYDLLQKKRVPGRALAQSEMGSISEKLRFSSLPEALVRGAALMKALSLYIAEEQAWLTGFEQLTVRSSPAFGAKEFIITPDAASAIAERVPHERLPRLDEQISETLACYHRGLRITPVEVGAWRLRRCALPSTTDSLLRLRVNRGPMKIAMTPLTPDAGLKGRPVPGFPGDEPDRFLLESVGEEEPQIRLLAEILERCHREGISILVLPELRMPRNLLRTVVDFLQRQSCDLDRGLLLVVAGSWHLEDQTTGSWVNRSVVLDCRGDVIWTHDKLAEYNITPENVAANPALKKQLRISDRGAREYIQPGTTLQFCDCPLGRLSVAICVGFFHQPLMQLLIESGANVFFVPAMTPRVKDIDQCAWSLVRSQHASTFVANCGTVALKEEQTGAIEEEVSACFYRTPAADRPVTMRCPTVTGDHLHIFNLNNI